MTTITDEDFEKIAHYLGKVIDGRKGKQILLLSDVSILDKLSLHPCNRNIDQEWVDKLKIPMMKLASDNESIGMMYIAIIKKDVEIAKLGENGNYSFKPVIIDFQHRFFGLKQIRDQIPDFNFNVYVTVYIVDNDQEIIQRINSINTRREFDNADNNDLMVRAIFKESLDDILGKRTKHRFVNQIYNNDILRDKQWTRKLWNHDKNWFKKRFITISKNYKSTYEKKIEDFPKFKTSVLGLTLQETQLYQLIDEKNTWLEQIPNDN